MGNTEVETLRLNDLHEDATVLSAIAGEIDRLMYITRHFRAISTCRKVSGFRLLSETLSHFLKRSVAS